MVEWSVRRSPGSMCIGNADSLDKRERINCEINKNCVGDVLASLRNPKWNSQLMKSSRSRPEKKQLKRRRAGIAVYELILVLPILLLVLLAVVEFGVLVANRQPLEMAVRDGALVASRLDLPPGPGPVPPEIISAIARPLAEIGVDVNAALTAGTMHVRLEHNWDSATSGELDPSGILSSGSLVCPEPTEPPAPDPDDFAFGRLYVRLTVCLRSDLLTPNLLETFCLDMRERTTAETKTYRYAFVSP